ncbi:MAG: hypothetical protein L6Q99_15600 [Planctomycetes bacterium]|nr:hypothetical protein [Planctomycetota bacterium]
MDDREQTTVATVKREIAWAAAFVIAGGVAFVVAAHGGANVERRPTATLWLVCAALAALTAFAAYREPRLGSLFPLALGGGAVLVYRITLDDPYWPLGVQTLGLATLPYFVIAAVAAMLGRLRRRTSNIRSNPSRT